MEHTLHALRPHYGWDNALVPTLRVEPGQEVTLAVREASDGQLHQRSQARDLCFLDQRRANPLTGPIHVAGAESGDALRITVLEVVPSGWGWTAVIPGFGLLADQFPEPALHLWTYDPTGGAPAAFGPGGRVPIQPFLGTIGVAPGAPGPHEAIPPRRTGGNMDLRDVSVGAVLTLPVEVSGAMLSVGDSHAAQGDGEVCGTALESALEVRLRIELLKDAAPQAPRLYVPDPASARLAGAGYDVTTGIGPDLMQGARNATSDMIELLGRREGMRPEDAYMLISVAGELRISEIVDAPNWVVSCYFPRQVFA